MSYGDFAPEDIGGYSGFVIIQNGYGVYYNSGSFRATFHPDKTYYVTRTILPSGVSAWIIPEPIEFTFEFEGWAWLDNYPFLYSARNSSWMYLLPSDEGLWCLIWTLIEAPRRERRGNLQVK